MNSIEFFNLYKNVIFEVDFEKIAPYNNTLRSHAYMKGLQSVLIS